MKSREALLFVGTVLLTFVVGIAWYDSVNPPHEKKNAPVAQAEVKPPTPEVKSEPEPESQPEPKPEAKPEPKPSEPAPPRSSPTPRPASPAVWSPPVVVNAPRTVNIQVINNSTGKLTITVGAEQKVLNASGQAFFDVPSGLVSASWSWELIDVKNNKKHTASGSRTDTVTSSLAWTFKDEYEFARQSFVLKRTTLR